METEKKNYSHRHSKRYSARLVAVQILYQNHFNSSETSEAVVKNYLAHHAQEILKQYDIIKPDENYCNFLIQEVLSNKEKIEKLIESNLSEKWTFSRLFSITQIILSCAVAEIIFSNIPEAIVVKEYKRIGALFLETKDTDFICSIINTIASQHYSVKD